MPAPNVRPQNRTHTQPAQRESTPFGAALYATRLITSRNPETEQPEELKKLQTAVSALSSDNQRSLVFRMVGETLQDHDKLPGLFAVAASVRVSAKEGDEPRGMLPVAHATAAVVKAMRAGLTPKDLADLGLVEAKEGTRRDGSPSAYLVPHIGRRTIESAVNQLRGRRDLTPELRAGLRELQAYLNRGAWNQLRAQAARKTALATTAPVPEEKSDTAA